MAISQISQHLFLPELLGLNLAIEISGLGNVYLRLSEEVEILGHPIGHRRCPHLHRQRGNWTHRASHTKAIQTYLDEIAASFGDDSKCNAHWRRIYSGYCSLQTASLNVLSFRLKKHYKFEPYRHEKQTK